MSIKGRIVVLLGLLYLISILFPSFTQIFRDFFSRIKTSNNTTVKKTDYEIDVLIEQAARRHNLDSDLIRAVIHVESNFNPRAVSPKNARGLMQLIPETAKRYGVVNDKDIFDPAQNIEAGSMYLADLLLRYNGNIELALAAYNWGEKNVDFLVERRGASFERIKHFLPVETRNYVSAVLYHWRKYRLD